jgi:hypothetical protein
MQPIVLDGRPRKCGNLQKGGCYGFAEVGEGGSLKAWVWLMAKPINNMIRCDVPDRTQVIIDPQMTLNESQLWLAEWQEKPKITFPHLLLVPGVGIADHVGKKFYTPFEFALECVERGPSRHLSPQIAKQLAEIVPCPVFFSHDEIPQPEDEKQLADLLAIIDPVSSDVMIDMFTTWLAPGFGLVTGSPSWTNHPLVQILAALDHLKPKDKTEIKHSQALFGVSWITKVAYILEDEEKEVPEDLAEAGIIPAVIGNEE